MVWDGRTLLWCHRVCVFLFVGPTCRTLRTSPAASTMKCIAWDASTRITRWWLMPTVSQNIISPPTRCRRRLPPSQRNSFVLRLWCSATVFPSLQPTPLQTSSPTSQGAKNSNACQRDFIIGDFWWLNGRFMSVYCFMNKSPQYRWPREGFLPAYS